MWRLMMPKARHVIALTIFLFLILILLLGVTPRTDAYQAAERFVLADARVTESVGSVIRAEFKFWKGFHFTSSSNGGEANFTFEVVGNKNVSTVEVHLRSSWGVWRVVTADIRTSDGISSRIVGVASFFSGFAIS